MKKTISKAALIFLLFAAVCSCSKKNDNNPAVQNSITIDSKSVSIHYDEIHQFSLTGGGNVSVSSYNWTSSDINVGVVDETGKFVAKKIGATTIKASKGNDVFEAQVTVLPYSVICKEPFWGFNDNMSNTKSKENRTLIGQTSTGLTYAGDNEKIRNILYTYDANGKMSSAAILFANTTAVIEESAKFFKERYTYLGVETNVYFYSDNKNVVIGITLDANLGFVAIYIPYTTSSGIINSVNAKTILDLVKNIKKVQ